MNLIRLLRAYSLRSNARTHVRRQEAVGRRQEQEQEQEADGGKQARLT